MIEVPKDYKQEKIERLLWEINYHQEKLDKLKIELQVWQD